jgi:predicted MFS family arabinose efflux permease
VEASLLVVAAAGALVFALADGTAGLVLGRGLIGFGVSACLMAAFRSFVTWFPPQRLPLVNGLQMAAGGFGALAATVPVELAVGAFGWRSMFVVLAVATLAVALLIFLVIPERPREGPAETMGEQLNGVRDVFTSALFWRLAPLTVASQASFLSIQGLWVGPWLRDVGGLSAETAANTLGLLAGVMIVAFILNGLLVERLHLRGVEPLHLAVAGMTAFILVQVLVIIGPGQHVTAVWLLFGYFGTTGILPYAVLPQRFPRALAGRVITAINLMVFVAAFAGQWGIGAVIELWPSTVTGGYQPAAYRAAFAVMLAAQVVSLLWYALAGWRARGEAVRAGTKTGDSS